MNKETNISWSVNMKGYITLIRGSGPGRVRTGAGRLPDDLLKQRGTAKGDKRIEKYLSRHASDFFDNSEVQEADRRQQFKFPLLSARVKRHLELNSGLAKLTLRQHELAVELLIECIGDKRLDEVTRQDANDFRRYLSDRDEKPNTIARRIQCIKCLYRSASEEYEDEGPLKNPFDKTSSQNRPPTQVNFRYVSIDDLNALVHGCKTTPRIGDMNRNGWKCLFGLCRLAGCRRSEALRAEWDDVDFETKMIWIGNKKTADRLATRDGMRKVPLHPILVGILRERYAQVGSEQTQIVGFNQRSGNLHRTFKSICKEAGIVPWPEPYQNMRRSMVTDGHKAGLAGSDIENVFGHGVDVSRQYYLMQSAERSRDLLWGNDSPEETDESET